jgi:hypothetical protein
MRVRRIAHHLRRIHLAVPFRNIRVDVLESSQQQLRDCRGLQTLQYIQNGFTHLVITEDMDQVTIETLGKKFGLNPEFFENHLLDAQYPGLRTDTEDLKSTNMADCSTTQGLFIGQVVQTSIASVRSSFLLIMAKASDRTRHKQW